MLAVILVGYTVPAVPRSEGSGPSGVSHSHFWQPHCGAWVTYKPCQRVSSPATVTVHQLSAPSWKHSRDKWGVARQSGEAAGGTRASAFFPSSLLPSLLGAEPLLGAVSPITRAGLTLSCFRGLFSKTTGNLKAMESWWGGAGWERDEWEAQDP